MSLEHSPVRGGLRGGLTQPDHDPVFRIPEAAKYLGLSESGLKKLRLAGAGPVFVKLTATAVGYRLSALNSYLDARSRRSTSDAGA